MSPEDVIALLLVIDCAVPAAVLLLWLFGWKRARIDHVMLFSFGFLFYWMLPVVFGFATYSDRDPVVANWFLLFAGVTTTTWVAYLAQSACCYVAFVSGALAGRGGARRANVAVPPPAGLLDAAFPLALGIAVIGLYAFRGQFLGGYGLIFSSSLNRGPFLATGVFCVSLSLVYVALRWQREGEGDHLHLVNHWTALALVMAAAGTLLGGRIHFVSCVVTVVVFRSLVQPLRRSSILGLVALGAGGAAVAGLIRFSFDPSLLSFENMGWSLVLEPVFTAYSLVDFLNAGRLDWFNAPRMLWSHLFNLVPSILVPGKTAFLLNPEDLGYAAAAPVGALSSWVSFTVDFGLAGTPPVLFLLGAALSRLRHRMTPLSMVCYAMICGVLPFSFFRDPFYSSIVKSMLQFGVLTPILAFATVRVVALAVAGAARAGVAGQVGRVVTDVRRRSQTPTRGSRFV